MPTGIYKRKIKLLIKEGDKYGRLTAIRFSHVDKRKRFWFFKCDCGKEKVICIYGVINKTTKSCGCFKREIDKINLGNFKHGMEATRTYRSWASMKTRCYNKNSIGYKNWGGRGITVCKKWLNSFENFYRDMGDRPDDKSLDRIDNNKGYCKSNCRWATVKEQNNNTRQNHLLTYKNKTQTIAQWADELNINYRCLYSRVNKGWSTERILTYKI